MSGDLFNGLGKMRQEAYSKRKGLTRPGLSLCLRAVHHGLRVLVYMRQMHLFARQ